MIKKLSIYLALTIGLIIPTIGYATETASAAPYCPTPTYCSSGVAGWLRYLTCGPWVYNPYIGAFIDRCNNILT